MSNYADNLDVIDAKGNTTNVLLQDRGTLAMVNALSLSVNNVINAIGNLENLDTSDKSNVVNAINSIVSSIGELSNLDTLDKSDIVSAINSIVTSNSVNVKTFGAVGDAKYYNKYDNHYYANAGFSQAPTNDYTAISNAIAFARANGIKTIFFPSGSYFCGTGTFTIGEDDICFKGETGSEIISEGLTSGAFITITAGSKYPASDSIISNLTILGAYFKNDYTKTNVSAIEYGSGSWTQGRSFDHLGIANFNIGIKFLACTEFHLNDSKLILCDTAVYFGGSGDYNPMPAWFTNVTIELNARGIYCGKGGFSTLFLTNCGLSGGSQLYFGYCAVKFTGCRMEFALDECCERNGTPVPLFDVLGESSADGISGLAFDNCQLMFTSSGGNYAKLLFWNGNVYTRNSDLDYLILVRNSYTSTNVPVTFTNCEILPGSTGFKFMVNEYYGYARVSYSNIKTTLYANRCIAMGNNMMAGGKLVAWNNTHISISNDNYVVDEQTSITLDVPRNATGISVHIEPVDNSVYLKIDPVQKDGYSANVAERMIPVNGDWTNQTLATGFLQNTETVNIVFGAGTFSSVEGNFWVEFIF